MMETLAVLLIFFVLVVLGIMFYGRVLKTSLEEDKEENLQLNAIKVAQRASSLPELQCSEDNIVSDNCIDLIKLNAASAIINTPENEIHYYDRLLFSKITITEIYPSENTWTLYDQSLEQFSNKIATNIPISLLNPVDDSHSFGIMLVEYYTQ